MHLLEGFLRFHLHEGSAFDVPRVSMSRHVHLSDVMWMAIQYILEELSQTLVGTLWNSSQCILL